MIERGGERRARELAHGGGEPDVVGGEREEHDVHAAYEEVGAAEEQGVGAEGIGHRERDDHHRRHHREHRDPGRALLGVDRVGEPRVGRPRPPHDPQHEQPAPQAAPCRIGRHHRRDLGEREDEDQVEEQLERGDALLGVNFGRLGAGLRGHGSGHRPTVLSLAVMIVMTPQATEAEIEAVVARLETTGVHVLVMPGELTTAIGAIGDPEGVRRARASRAWRASTASSRSRGPTSSRPPSSPTTSRRSSSVDGRRVGAPDTFCLIAGPCTVETREQTLEVAARGRRAPAPRCCAAAPSSRAPRRSPSRGWASAALEILAEARADTGLPVVTELLDTQHAEAIAEHADVVQIGARNMQNYALLEVAGKLGKPVLLKRGLSSTLEELLLAADYILKEGNEAVMLCERGIRTFETATRFTLDLVGGAVAQAPHPPAGDRRSLARLRRPPARRAARRAPPPRWAPTASSSRSTRPRRRAVRRPAGALRERLPRLRGQVAAHAALLGKRLA